MEATDVNIECLRDGSLRPSELLKQHSDYGTKLAEACGNGASAQDVRMGLVAAEFRTFDDSMTELENNTKSVTEDVLCELLRYAYSHLPSRLHREHIKERLSELFQ